MPPADSKRDIKVECSYLSLEELKNEDFVEFSEKFFGKGSFANRFARMRYFASLYDFRCLSARMDGRYMGQTCGYKAYAVANGNRQELWWSFDTFVLAESRGMGIGKMLQAKLHRDLPNFTSAWYSPINGIIKRKCGANAIFEMHMAYYPVSRLWTVIADALCRKLFKKPFPLSLPLPYFYSKLNAAFRKRLLRAHELREISLADLQESDFRFISESLKKYDFYIERSPEFIRWRYSEMPRGVRLYKILHDGELCAFAACSLSHAGSYRAARVQVSCIYDLIIGEHAELTDRDVMVLLADAFRQKGEKLDGFLSSLPTRYHGKIHYPLAPIEVLSTNQGKYRHPYFTYADQDLDQI